MKPASSFGLAHATFSTDTEFMRKPRALLQTLFFAFLSMATWIVSPAAGLQTLTGHVSDSAGKNTPLGALPPDENMSVAIGLPLRHEDQLDALLRDLYDPSSPKYRHFLTPDEFTDRFGPTESDYKAVERFAAHHGLTVTFTQPNRTLLGLKGTVQSVQDAFHVGLRRYRRPKGGFFHAPDREPSLDLDVKVQFIHGLDNSRLPHPMIKVDAKKARPQTGTGLDQYYGGYDFRNIYLPCLLSTDIGAGQTIALVEFDAYYKQDIVNYASDTGMPAPSLTNVLIDNFSGTPYNLDYQAEVALDIEMAFAMAPGANIRVYEISPLNAFPDHMLSRIANDNVAKQISCSWSNFSTITTVGTLKQFQTQGQSFFQASGDSGAYAPGGPITAVPDPIYISPYITVVGGTSLTTTGNSGTLGVYSSETTWNDHPTPGTTPVNAVSSGGVCSGASSLAVPTYQIPFVTTANKASLLYRNIPDVALVADNVLLYLDNGYYTGSGGTSASAPLWAGLMALVNQKSLAAGHSVIGYANPAIYTLAANAAHYANDFRDIADGSTNNYWSTDPTTYQSVAGYDLTTGLGTPRCTLLYDLAGVPTPTWTFTPTTTRTFTPTFTPTITRTPTPTFTRTITSTPTQTSTPTSTPTGTWYTSTFTPTPTSTFTITRTSTRTFTFTSTFTPTKTLSPTSTFTFTPTPTITPQQGVILYPVLAPVPVRLNQSFCLYSPTACSQIRLEFFDPSGMMAALKSSSNPSDPCWNVNDLPIGLYWVRIQTTDSSGQKWTGTQKVLVTP